MDVLERLGEGFGEEFEVGAIELGGGDEGEVAVAGDGDQFLQDAGGKLLESRRLENHEEANPATSNNQQPTSNIQ